VTAGLSGPGSEPAPTVGGAAATVLTGTAPESAPAVAYLLPGQGAQHPGMGRGLYEHEPAFREVIDRGAELLAGLDLGPGLGLDRAAGLELGSGSDSSLGPGREAGIEPELARGFDLRRVLWPADGEDPAAATARLTATAVAQPALVVVETALAAVWRSWGVEPRALLGHSLGEWVAAHLAGVLSFEDGLRLVAIRGRLMGAQPPGAMLAVALDAAEIEPELAALGGVVTVAAVNAPGSAVVSGPEAEIEALG
jgi:acyl transferase domain-containing protein